MNELDTEALTARLEAIGEDVVVRTADATEGGFCIMGLMRWLDTHGFDRSKAFREGVPASAILAKNDAYGNRAVNVALRKVEK